MKKIYKILKFMEQNRKVFYFFNVKYERGIIAKDKNGNPILLDGEDLDDLKKFINMDNSSKIQNMLKDLFEKRYICNSSSLTNDSPYGDLIISPKGFDYLEYLDKNSKKVISDIFKFLCKFMAWLIPTLISGFSYFFPNETKIQAIVKTELKNINIIENTTNVNMRK